MDVTEVLAQIRKGDRQAFAGIVRHYQRPLFGYLGRMGLTRHHAEEIAQEVFLRVWSRLGSYDASRAQFSTWLFAIARNLALNEYERSARVSEISVIPPDAELDDREMWDTLTERDRRTKLQAALRSMSPAERNLVALAYTQDLPLAELAKLEECSVGAIKVRLHRAKGRLRALLEVEDE